MIDTATTNVDLPDPTWDAHANTQARAKLADVRRADFWDDPIEKQYNALRSLWTPEDNEPLPTDEAFQRAVEVLEETSLVMTCHREGTDDPVWDFPVCFIATADDGSVRMEWWYGKSHCISLNTGHSDKTPITIFTKFGTNDSGHLSQGAYPHWLAVQLVRLNKARQQG